MPLAHLRSPARLILLIAVGLAGLAITAWLALEVGDNADLRVQQRFESAARQRAALIVKAFAEPLEEFSLLQRFFHSVGEVEPSGFARFAEPMIDHDGVRCVGWAPAVDDARRGRFEASGRALWGDDFAIREVVGGGEATPAAPRARYFPAFYVVADEVNPRLPGLDIYWPPGSRALIEQSLDENAPITSDAGSSTVFAHAGEEHSLLLLTPVYRGAGVPSEAGERQAAVRGMLFMILDSGEVFVQANRAAATPGLRVSLIDRTSLPGSSSSMTPSPLVYDGGGAGAVELGGEADGRLLPLLLVREFTVGNRPLTLRIEAGPAWRAENSSSPASLTDSPIPVAAAGVLLTLLLLVALNRLLARSALADSLARTHAVDQAQQRIAATWVNKLSCVVEQNPAAIVITDLAGHIEYVNDQFIESTGHLRSAVLGQKVQALVPEIVAAPGYREMTPVIRAGKSWRCEFQTQRHDGLPRWERMSISPIRNPEGAITNYVAISENVTELHTVMTRLSESEARFRSAVSVMVEGLAILSPEGRFVFANRAVETMLGCAEGGLQGQSFFDVDLERLRDDGTVCLLQDDPVMIALVEGREVRDHLIGYRLADGQLRWVEINASPLLADEYEQPGVVVTFAEMTGRQRAEEQLKLAFEAIRCSGEGILVTDAERRILSVNPAFEAVTGYSAAEVAGQDPAIVASARHDQHFYATMHETLARNDYWQGEIWNQRKNGEIYPEWLGVSVVRERNGQPKYYVYIYSDMSERKAAQERIEFLAHHDPLTGLPNRLLLRDRVEQAQTHAARTGSRMALMFLDLDRFKTINDSLGHPVGDILLKEVVERLKHCVRESDTVCRQGGDEFIILLHDVKDRNAVDRVADKVHQRMADPFVLGGHALNTSFSIGVALYPDDGEDFDSLLQKADTAMYHAKGAGRNAHRFFTEEMNLQAVEHLTLETRLRTALENHEFVLHYQPQMDLRDGSIVGVEALIRWKNT
ncbi:MAG: diguanylate cyclase, partial [Propionivibrio sp.]